VRRALQRAEPGAQPGFRGDPRTGLLGDVLFGVLQDQEYLVARARTARAFSYDAV
jgi:hypothetical protein